MKQIKAALAEIRQEPFKSLIIGVIIINLLFSEQLYWFLPLVLRFVVSIVVFIVLALLYGFLYGKKKQTKITITRQDRIKNVINGLIFFLVGTTGIAISNTIVQIGLSLLLAMVASYIFNIVWNFIVNNSKNS